MSDTGIRALTTHNLLKAYGQTASRPAKESGFGDLLQQSIAKTDLAQKQSDQMVSSAIMGQEKDLHRVMIAQEEAALTFELFMEVRNRLMDAYQQIMQMQV
ncbi:MAG: flagellar hook-basal body complex protein FliE [Candidatus Krumholzibacteria bacterium]|jgi:flagellar hook-basal body complex protein FliE|nr:flagellar hook-basal body complex protein FliE [Candidatus Krumholzibacteria bacterium]MDP6670012.1 flagellar hook-basal body complex protein FliE [Candidatus Krumholzibacteria bacterium]MDP7020958.1 flagellar hook-basal body complex protein FliE [Candidatus Krumholzibacteria bacterium]